MELSQVVELRVGSDLWMRRRLDRLGIPA